MPRYSEEQIRRANSVDLVELLRRKSETLKRDGHDYRWMRHKSVTVYGNQWYRHSKEYGGLAISFMQEFYDLSFKEAVNTLLNGENGAEFAQTSCQTRVKKPFELPKRNSNIHRVFAYLTKTRGIDADIVSYFAHGRSIYESAEHHNIVFVGYDENGTPKQAHMKSTISGSNFKNDLEGSDKRYSFRHKSCGNTLYAFESAVDMLSFITLNKDNWQRHNYISLGGVSELALVNMLESNPNIDAVYLCLDNDKAGHEATKRIGKILTERGYRCDTLVPVYKDWNEDLTESIKEQEYGMKLSM